MTRGVYIIKDLKTGYVYIGSSNHIEARVFDHFEALDQKKHYNWKLQKAYNSHKRHFIWGIAKVFDRDATRDQIYDYEQHLMDCTPKKYNLLINARDHLLTDKKKRQKARQGKLYLK